MKEAGHEIPLEVFEVAQKEGVDPEKLAKLVHEGKVVIPKNVAREIPSIGIGHGLRTKINANLGTSPDFKDIDLEIEKARIAIEYGSDTIMDLSTGGDIDKIRKKMLGLNVPLGTVPIYQAGITALKKKGAIIHMDEDTIFSTIEKHAKDGVDFITVHCGVTKETVERLIKQKRTTNIVSRGGSFLAAYIIHNQEENPLYKNYDYLLEISKEYDLTLSLGDGLRPGCLADSSDRPQIQELIILGELVQRAREYGVQTIVEGPGHMPLNEIEGHVKLQKSICRGAPFYVLGPIVTDIAPGYDHITSAIGGAIAAASGADFLCYVTPSEHLGLPSKQDVKEGVIAAKIAAHAGDIVKGIGRDLDQRMAKARMDLDWEGQFSVAIDPYKAREYRSQREPYDRDVCTMCGEYCAIKIVKEYFRA